MVSRKVTEKLKLTRLKPTTLRRSPWFLDSQVSSIMAAPSLSFSVRSRSISRRSCHAILQLRSRLSLLQTGRLHSSTSAVLILRQDPIRQSDWSMFMPTELIVSASCDLLPRWRAAGGASLWLRNMNIYGPNKYPTWYKDGPPSTKSLHYATTISSTTPLSLSVHLHHAIPRLRPRPPLRCYRFHRRSGLLQRCHERKARFGESMLLICLNSLLMHLFQATLHGSLAGLELGMTCKIVIYLRLVPNC